MDAVQVNLQIFDDTSRPEFLDRWRADLEAEGYQVTEGNQERLGNYHSWAIRASRENESEKAR